MTRFQIDVKYLCDSLVGVSTFTMEDITKVTMCGQLRTVQDIKVGEKVTVAYHESSGELLLML
jgi:hypothetical protein